MSLPFSSFPPVPRDDDLGFLGFFLGVVGKDDAARADFFRLEPLEEDPGA